MAAYDYLNQSLVATALIQPHDIDSFYNPTVQLHTGFAADGTHYTAGVQEPGPVYASWFTEAFGPYRGSTQAFPSFGLILLSKVALTILDQSIAVRDPMKLPLWMQFLLSDNFALANNFDNDLNGFTPSGLAFADGVLSVIYTPDQGNQTGAIQSNMVVTTDFTQDTVYLDVAL